MSGLSHLTGYADGPPIKPGNFFCDQNAAVHAAFATLCALWHRGATGEGQHVELAMIEGEFQILADAYMNFAMNGCERRRSGNDYRGWAPHDTFPAQGEDCWIAIAVETDAQFKALCEVMERPELAQDARFAGRADRYANREALYREVTAWTATLGAHEAQETLQAAGVPAGAALDAMMILSDPHVMARRGLEYVETAGVGPTPYPRPAFVLSGTAVPLAAPAPPFGSANRLVFEEILGMSEDERARLYEAGVTSDEPLGRER
jgi:crotonobetainyl-CoA:carnitine CoA-transferase CaiB-like acyl-CoA transferase